MQLRIFQARLDPSFTAQDQNELNQFMDSVYVKKTTTQYVPSEPDFWSILVFYEQDTQPKKAVKQDVISDLDFSEGQRAMLSALKTWRRDKAHELKMAEFMILPNAALNGVVVAYPKSLTDLRLVKGFGETKIHRYGDDILAVVNAF